MRTYSAEVKYDNNGNSFYGVYQGSHFIMEFPNMRLAAEAAENFSKEYIEGINVGESMKRKAERFGIKKEGDYITLTKAKVSKGGINDKPTMERPFAPKGADPVEPPPPPEPPPVRVHVEGKTLSSDHSSPVGMHSNSAPLTEGTMKGGNGAVKRTHPFDFGSGTGVPKKPVTLKFLLLVLLAGVVGLGLLLLSGVVLS